MYMVCIVVFTITVFMYLHMFCSCGHVPLSFSIFPSVVRFVFGLTYAMLFTVLGGMVPTEYLATKEYAVSGRVW